jgi:hypothetical protein
VLLWFRERRREHPNTTPRNLAILYDSETAWKAISRDHPPIDPVAAAFLCQELIVDARLVTSRAIASKSCRSCPS